MADPPEGFIGLYLRVRAIEGRLYDDDIVRELPETDPGHPLHAEWRMRSASCARFVAYVREQGRDLSVLDCCCGNGWLTRRLAQCPNVSVVGLDWEGPELHQARRVCSGLRNIRWVAGDARALPFAPRSFEMVVIACAIQYVPNLGSFIETLVPLLAANGEIHILDSPLYEADQLAAARSRSDAYYGKLGVREMASHYHHHPVSSLTPFAPDFLYLPSKPRAGEARTDSPFPWIRLRPRS